MKRMFILPAAVLIQTCLGGVYAWSAFVPVLRSEYGFSTAQTQIVFGLTIASFTIAMVLAGCLLARWGARRVGLLGGLLFTAGYLLAAQANGWFPALLGGIGLVAGASIGFGYVAALTTAVQWFPRHKGLVSGVSVAGFGAGAILLSSVVSRFLRDGWSVLNMFRAIGWVYGAIICAAALCLFRPVTTSASVPAVPAQKKLLGDPFFKSLFVGMFCGTFAGLLVVGNLKPIGMDGGLSASEAMLAISFLAIGNTVGRIGWGWIADRLGYRAIPLSLILLGVALGILLGARVSAWSFFVAALLVGLGFGACFVLYAAQVAAHFGTAAVAKIYPLVFLAYGLAGTLGPWIGGHLFDLTASYVPPMIVAIFVLSIGAGYTWTQREVAARIPVG